MVPNKNQNWVNNTWDKLETILKTTMDEIIPIKSIVKSDQPRRPKLKSKTYKTYKWCLHIIRSIKRDDLEKITIGKKHKFIDNLQYIIQKYNWNNISIYNITNGLFSNNKDVLLSLLKELSLLIKTKLDVEDRQFIIDQIENNVNKRLERLDTHKKLMLNSILEREQHRIDINRIIVKNANNEEELLLEETDILRETAKHFKKITDNIVEKDEELENYWAEEYKPREDINDEIYEDLLNPINTEEWITTIKNLPKNKAAGPSKITYDVIQRCSGKFLDILRKFYNILLKIGLLPKIWSKGVIYPIPKPGEWNLDLNKTRPITLLECLQKLLMKILTSNTIEPIYILNNIIKEAREKSKEV